MAGWLLPVYREGYTDPFYGSWGAMDPFRGHDPFGGMMRDMDRTMRAFDRAMFPYHEPGMFRPESMPSQLAPKGDDKTYRIEIAAKEFQPNEITVKTLERDGKNFLVAEGKHETKDDSGFHSVHHFKRQYMVPDNVKMEDFKSQLAPDGTLSIEAPKQPEKPAIKAQNIPIEMKK